MTEKRFFLECEGMLCWVTDSTKRDDENDGHLSNQETVDELNELSEEIKQLKSDIIAIEKRADKVYDENKQLKKEYDKLKHRHSLLHDVCIEAECDRDRYYNDVLSLEKENEQLKKDLKKQFVPFAKADEDYTTVNTEEFIKILNENEELKQSMDNLFNYFSKWFEEERGIYAEDFCILWGDIQKGDV